MPTPPTLSPRFIPSSKYFIPFEIVSATKGGDLYLHLTFLPTVQLCLPLCKTAAIASPSLSFADRGSGTPTFRQAQILSLFPFPLRRSFLFPILTMRIPHVSLSPLPQCALCNYGSKKHKVSTVKSTPGKASQHTTHTAPFSTNGFAPPREPLQGRSDCQARG